MNPAGHRDGAATEAPCREPLDGARFPTTAWTALAEASLAGDEKARQALEDTCRRYWQPVYRFIRMRRSSDSEAQDLTQEFFLHVINKRLFSRADPLRGRFRSFLLGALTRFLADEWDRRRAQRRGGGATHLSFDESAIAVGVGDGQAMGGVTTFDREWACTILENALRALNAEFVAAGEGESLDVLKAFLPGGSEPPSYEVAAARLGMSVPALKSAIHRLRRRFRALVLQEVGQTVSAPHEIGAEVAHLQAVLLDRSSEFPAERET